MQYKATEEKSQQVENESYTDDKETKKGNALLYRRKRKQKSSASKQILGGKSKWEGHDRGILKKEWGKVNFEASLKPLRNKGLRRRCKKSKKTSKKVLTEKKNRAIMYKLA